MDSASAGDDCLFEDAPPSRVQRWLGLISPNRVNVGRRALLVILIAWLPLLVLTVMQGAASSADPLSSLLGQVDVHARYLLAAPLLIAAEAECAPRLNLIVRQFATAGLVPQAELRRFDAAVASTRRLVDATAVEIAVAGLAYLLVFAVAVPPRVDQIPAWQGSFSGGSVLSPAGWWHALVSLPLLLVLFFGWMWRLILWARLLWQVSRLRLRLIPAHPDRAASLGFVGHSVRAFSIVALALATIPAGRSAYVVLFSRTLPKSYLYFDIGLLVFLFALFTAPLFVFTPTLLRMWRRGVFAYGALANHVGAVFERKWLGRTDIDDSALERQDFSATTDLYQIVSNVYAIRFVPIGVADLIILAGAILLPFVPVVLIVTPAELIWDGIKGLLL